MWNRIRLEVSVAAAVALAIAALVLALRDGGSEQSTAVQESDAGDRSVAAAAPEGALEATINVFAYQPDPLRVTAGTPIVWKNIDSGVPHTVTAKDGSFDSGVMEMGETYSLTLDEPGTYVYICTLHPPAQASFFGATHGERLAGGGGGGMKGTIIVE
jgi:plastocyanin